MCADACDNGHKRLGEVNAVEVPGRPPRLHGHSWHRQTHLLSVGISLVPVRHTHQRRLRSTQPRALPSALMTLALLARFGYVL